MRNALLGLRRRGRGLREYRQELGTAYAAVLSVRWIVEFALRPIDDYLLRVEGAAGILGPAHRGYRDQSAADNRTLWSRYDWSRGGEEWGSPESRAALLEAELIPRVPADAVIVEIGPGAGRWSQDLRRFAKRLVLVDVSDAAVEICRRRFGDADNVEVVHTEAASLPGVASGSVDAVWSMEAFVHMAPLDVAAYLAEIARVLKPGGFALIHHAGRHYRPGWRAPMTSVLFARLARDRGLAVERQFDSWADDTFDVHASHDVITVLRQSDSGGGT